MLSKPEARAERSWAAWASVCIGSRAARVSNSVKAFSISSSITLAVTVDCSSRSAVRAVAWSISSADFLIRVSASPRRAWKVCSACWLAVKASSLSSCSLRRAVSL